MSPKTDRTPWHALQSEEVMARLGSGPQGLSESEAAARREQYGPNLLPAPPRRGPLMRFLAQFNNLLILVLLAAALVTALLGHWIDTGVILAVVLVNAVIGFIQEGKAEKALDAIRDMLSPHALVQRDGARRTVPAEELVPGDVVFLESGDRVPADLRLIQAKGLMVQEAALTGESVPVEKTTGPVDVDAPLGDRSGLAFSSTLVTTGRGAGVVVETGSGTEIGRIGRMLSEVEPLTTPLLRAMDTFAKWLTGAVLVVAALIFAFGVLLRGYDMTEMFMAVVGIAVAAIPEGLPAILTVTLAIGVQRMARRNAIVRRLPAVEALGSVSVICSDKTGTLTRNEMTVRTVATAETLYRVAGTGYDPHGAIARDGADRDVELEAEPVLVELARAGALCNEADLRQTEGGWSVAGDPMEGALLSLASKAGLEMTQERGAYPRTDVIPFESEHRFMASLHHDHDGNGYIFVKGAPEQVVAMCARQRTPGGDVPIEPDFWLGRVEEMAADGQRVLAMAARRTDADHRALTFADVEKDLVLLGLAGLIDPPRDEAITAVAECHTAGIRVKMITGDHAATARAIAGQIGLINARDVMTGPQIEAADDAALRRAVAETDVFARAAPEHKLRLVTALQAEGYTIAMTGDGVNDAPALKRSDVGVAMGHKGTEAAKQAAEMVLADDNFASIAAAVREGRTVYDNLKKAILFLLPVNGGESMTVIIAILAGLTLPITPLQILWVNMVSSVALAMALAFEPPEPKVMRRPPRPPGEPILSGMLLWRIGFVSTVFLAGVMGMFQWALASGLDVGTARTLAVNTLVGLEVFYLFSVRYLYDPSLTMRGIKGTKAVLIAVGVVTALQLFFTYVPFMHTLFGTVNLSVGELALVIGVAIAGFAVFEVEKALRRHAFKPAQPRAGNR